MIFRRVRGGCARRSIKTATITVDGRHHSNRGAAREPGSMRDRVLDVETERGQGCLFAPPVFFNFIETSEKRALLLVLNLYVHASKSAVRVRS